MGLGLGNTLSKGGLTQPGIITSNLVLKHKYDAGAVVPVSDGAAYFDNTNSQVTSSIPASTFHGDFSISMWVKRVATGSDDILAMQRDGNNDGVELFFRSANTLRLSLDASDIETTTTFTDIGRWYHITVVQDDANNDQQIYIDGVLDTSGTADVSVNHDTANFTLGTSVDKTSDDFKGYMCNVGIWSGALTQPQVKSIMWKNYAGLIDSEKTNLVSWYNFSSNANDETGNYNGTLE